MDKSTFDTLNKKIQELSESGQAYLNDAELQEKIRKIKSDAESLIRKNPIASVGLGLFIGYLIGRIFRRD
jgi:ElaB/YqjD/DUF883 family membrane-anchored ribosome-binding protein